MGVKAGARRRCAYAECFQSIARLFYPFSAFSHAFRVRQKFLPHPYGHRVLKVGPCGFYYPVKQTCLFSQFRGKSFECFQQSIRHPERGQPHRGREDIVCGLRHVYMVVGMDEPVVPFFPAEKFYGPVCYYLVCVHVVGGACPCLIDINYEISVESSGNHFPGGLHDCAALFSGKKPQPGIHIGRGPFYHGRCAYEFPFGRNSAYREILGCPERLYAVIDACGEFPFTEWVLFGSFPGFFHGRFMPFSGPRGILIRMWSGSVSWTLPSISSWTFLIPGKLRARVFTTEYMVCSSAVEPPGWLEENSLLKFT